MGDWRNAAKCYELADEYAQPTADNRVERSIWYLFFEGFEQDANIRPLTKSICAQCPVRRECLDDGLKNNETGVRAGVYLMRGHIDETKNAGMTVEELNSLKELI